VLLVRRAPPGFDATTDAALTIGLTGKNKMEDTYLMLKYFDVYAQCMYVVGATTLPSASLMRDVLTPFCDLASVRARVGAVDANTGQVGVTPLSTV
jgi:hypothetical protein